MSKIDERHQVTELRKVNPKQHKAKGNKTSVYYNKTSQNQITEVRRYWNDSFNVLDAKRTTNREFSAQQKYTSESEGKIKAFSGKQN